MKNHMLLVCMATVIAVLVIALFLPNNSGKRDAARDQHTMNFRKNSMVSLKYTKDSRTNLCFATYMWVEYSNYGRMTNVPCTPEVENLLDK